MNARLLAFGFGVVSVPLFAQTPARDPMSAEVQWQEVADRTGSRAAVPVFSLLPSDGPTSRVQRVSFEEPRALLRQDDQWRRAKAAGDRAAMESLAGPDFAETIADGVNRGRADAIDTWTRQEIRSIAAERATIRVSGNIATISGQERQVSDASTQSLIFTRVYTRPNANAPWSLISSTEFPAR